MMTNMKKDHFDEEPPFSDEEKRLYQAAYKKIQDDIDVSFYNPEKSFSEIQKRLGLTQNEIQKKSSDKFFGGGILTTGRGFFHSSSYVIASLILMVGLGGISIYQGQLLKNTSSGGEEILRSSQQISLVVKDPAEEANKLQMELMRSGISYFVSGSSDQGIIIKIPINSQTRELLLKRRIELPDGKYCDLNFEKLVK